MKRMTLWLQHVGSSGAPSFSIVGPGLLVLGLLLLSNGQVGSAQTPGSKSEAESLGPGFQLRFTEQEKGEGKTAAMPSPPGVLLELEIEESGLKSLQSSPREPVDVVVRYVEQGKSVRSQVRVHLKGAKGSFQSVQERPSLTLEFPAGSRFFGLSKVHLNKSVEDHSDWNERMGAELLSQGGVPAARSGHAVVVLNGKSLGLYVLKEGFEPELFERYFPQGSGVVYESSAGTSPWWGRVQGRWLGQEESTIPRETIPSLRALANALGEEARTRRWRALNGVLDVEAWSTFMALEMLLSHRDGYCLAQNNFKVYWNSKLQKWWFMPHGMDQILGKIQVPVDAAMSGPVAVAFLELPEGEVLYRGQLRRLMKESFSQAGVEKWVRQWEAELVPRLSRVNRRVVSDGARDLLERWRSRWKFLEADLKREPVRDLKLERGGDSVPLLGWKRTGMAEKDPHQDGGEAMHVESGELIREMQIRPDGGAGWRSEIKLDPGQYRLRVWLEAEGVVKLGYGKFHGTRIRVEDAAGQMIAQSESVLKTGPKGKEILLNFEVSPGHAGLISVVWEGRGEKGRVKMRGSPRLQRIL